MVTKKLINKFFLLASTLVLQTTYCQTQQATIASGGNTTGSGGNMSYSIGQITYTTTTGINGTMAQGIQQPYEIFTVLGKEELEIQLDLMAYPNPTNDYLTLTLNKSILSELSFELIDNTGKLIETRKINNAIQTIQMVNLPSANYFIRVNNKGKVVKVFKIIKN
jgi:hypothetical protein